MLDTSLLDPSLMSREQLETEVKEKRKRGSLDDFQRNALQQIQNISCQALSTPSAHISKEKFESFKRKIVDLSRHLMDAVVNISDIGKESIIGAARSMCRLALDIANYICDNFASIITNIGLSLGVCMIVFDVVLLAGLATSMVGIAIPAAQGATVFLDFAAINDLAGF